MRNCFQVSGTRQTRIAASRKGNANGNCNTSSKLEIIHAQGRASRCDRNTRDGLLVSNGSSARTNSTVSTESTWALVRLDSAATTVPLGHRTIPGVRERNGDRSCRALRHRHYVGVSLYSGDGQAGVAAPAISLRARVRCFTNSLPWLIMFPAMGYGFFGVHGPSGTRLFLSSLCSHASYGLGLWIAMYVIKAKLFGGYAQPDFKGEAAR